MCNHFNYPNLIFKRQFFSYKKRTKEVVTRFRNLDFEALASTDCVVLGKSCNFFPGLVILTIKMVPLIPSKKMK